MAKNKNRKQSGSKAAETASQQTKEKSAETISSIQSSAGQPRRHGPQAPAQVRPQLIRRPRPQRPS
ncbi:hypothetical protein NQP46_07335 [Streptomyces albus]|nr:hypothetical protein NQP46_07335 [Streptomyces albus]